MEGLDHIYAGLAKAMWKVSEDMDHEAWPDATAQYSQTREDYAHGQRKSQLHCYEWSDVELMQLKVMEAKQHRGDQDGCYGRAIKDALCELKNHAPKEQLFGERSDKSKTDDARWPIWVRHPTALQRCVDGGAEQPDS
ncbi:MAG: hypothetical protein ABJA62_08965 [Luteimonas sp.]